MAAAQKKTVAIPTDFNVAERRLQNGDLAELSRGSNIELVDQPEPMVVYWAPINGNPSPWHMLNVLGWQYVTPKDLGGKPSDLGLDEQDGHIVKGGRDDQEVLFKMPKRLREGIAMKKTEDFYRKMSDGAKAKSVIQKGLSDTGDDRSAELIGRMEGTLDGGVAHRLGRATEAEPEPVK